MCCDQPCELGSAPRCTWMGRRRSGDVECERNTRHTHQCWHDCRVTSEKRRRACRGACAGAESGEAQPGVSGTVETRTCSRAYPHRCPTTRCGPRRCQRQTATRSCRWWVASASRCRWCWRTAGEDKAKKRGRESGAVLSAPGTRRAPHCDVRGHPICQLRASHDKQARAGGEERRYGS